MYLLDTTIISAARLPHRNPAVARWLRAVPDRDLFTAVLVLGEIEQGIRRRERTDAAQGAVLRYWYETAVVPSFGTSDRALPFDHRAARVYGRYPVPEDAPSDDAHIAAVAEAHGLIVVTRNVKHYEPLGVRDVNPFDA
ncbi:PilT protein domain protein [Xylanimonas cellulosilytica DSM 15894]|uniref:Ribonuclease VapC n=1 Tax=Xylanimonas cellulosilytica (strain DSM 15894 / JCM 12276 / CECT 5975 / KCTC 9989 / LMG 20990 / NBRC 107835 / XIL07) TaxID=446471 RepID=D1BS64_XYLCX|nr:type II toxin-antitoxin system VapC family toxin [Xylanimonas cellulosilytica]ACZ30556.1 PilT protein domain protein [Xylanimonas cellulosilytica DSM 15894]